MSKVHVMEHPLISHKISYIRKEDLGSKDFREMISEIAMLICYEATRNLRLCRFFEQDLVWWKECLL